MKKLLASIAFLLLAVPAYAASTSVLFVGNNTGGVVNGVQVLGATTGNTPVISSQGSDTDVGLILSTQGAGALNLETAGAGNVILAPGSGNVVIPAFSTAGIVFNNSSGALSTGTALPNGTTATTQSSGDNSTKVATTAYVDGALSGGGVKSFTIQTFASSGTYTPNAHLLYAKIEVVGSGGGGGSSSHPWISAPGGGSGAYASGIFSAATIGSSQTVTVVTGGAGGSAGGNAGSNGSTTSVGSLVSAGGGFGGPAITYSNGPLLPGAGGSTASGTITFNGNPGITGFGLSGWGNGNAGPGGGGGTSIFGGAGLGGTPSGGAGGAGTTGSGGGGSGPGGTNAGGSGGNGYVIITEFNSQ